MLTVWMSQIILDIVLGWKVSLTGTRHMDFVPWCLAAFYGLLLILAYSIHQAALILPFLSLKPFEINPMQYKYPPVQGIGRFLPIYVNQQTQQGT